MTLRIAAPLAGLLASVALGAAASAHEATPPDALVRNVTLEVADLVAKDKDIQGGDRRKIIALVEAKVMPHFNFTSMTASALGANWNKASPEQKQRLIEEFRLLMVRTYASSIAAYREQKFDFRPLRTKATDTDVTINVRVLQSGAQPVKIDYDMEKTAQGWKVWDVRVADVSLTATYRAEFASVVRDSGIDGLIKALQTKNRGLERSPVAGVERK